MKSMTSIEVQEEYNQGKRIFEDSQLNYAIMEYWNLDEVIFKNCKFTFSSFRFASLKKSKFINCEFFFHSFFTANLEGAVFENCKIDACRFDSAAFDKTLFKKCDISYVLAMDTIRSGADFTSSVLFNVVFNKADINEGFVNGAMGFVMPFVESLDMEIKSHIKLVIKRYAQEADVDVQLPNEHKDARYGSTSDSRDKAPGAYSAFSGIFDEIINGYKNNDIYKSKTSIYDKKDIYNK